ncbi:hypothetical protein [Cellvibrio japonicus]|uniref:Uncharacterized protein n=1 Tax=Cellvibrio japonicus (strain Ueda107) TaxID=498211 RepID=B3PI24_CELJU|nr:hypothetical protein [Cellvibrio japonicus]ACE85803.1 hypothetical protein CJA_0363 [Cellvibrio japonicus Ueda107]QEI11075.1 hypothetical protein FY117_01755 [Cellvibrio japonicus]QEI14649.1 hypothetical protein FY116_01755 [Cellvibrio japonicus]QEI18229.1 hypothetical protein FY115_01755 [Cellvibrio japonicus]
MQYTRPMIDLVYEVRRRVDADMKPSVKLANPDLLKELATYYQATKDTITKTLIKELLTMAGDEWAALLFPKPEQAEYTAPDTPRQIVKVYRGQTMLIDAPSQPQEHKPGRMYRGQPVSD